MSKLKAWRAWGIGSGRDIDLPAPHHYAWLKKTTIYTSNKSGWNRMLTQDECMPAVPEKAREAATLEPEVDEAQDDRQQHECVKLFECLEPNCKKVLNKFGNWINHMSVGKL
ncbi:MAG: hypothetical protein GY820_42050 [Gammaproteobacteria bacterium]|nr:hypothetical protein [Gammaproteobacteria bacterium]